MVGPNEIAAVVLAAVGEPCLAIGPRYWMLRTKDKVLGTTGKVLGTIDKVLGTKDKLMYKGQGAKH